MGEFDLDDLTWIDRYDPGFNPRVVHVEVVSAAADISKVKFAGSEGEPASGVVAVSDWLLGPFQVGQRAIAVQLDDADPARMSSTDPALLVAAADGVSPEVRTGVVRVMGVARLPGRRSKLAVAATVADVDPVTALVGRAHWRVDLLREVLGGEQVDIVAWHPDRLRFLANAFQPATVSAAWFDTSSGVALVASPDHQMPAAVGSGGLNSKLAGQLVGVTVRVVPESRTPALVEKLGPPTLAF